MNQHPDIPFVPTQSRQLIVAGWLVIVLGIGGFVGWAVSAPLAQAVVASGMIKVNSNRKQIQHLEGGIVKEILVRDGDQVSQGDVLVRLDETRAAASLVILQDSLNAALAQEARLTAERDGAAELVMPEALRARNADNKVAEILKSQNTLFEARQAALAGQIQILEKQIAHLGEDIGGLKSQKAAKSRQLGFVRDELKGMRSLLTKGLTGKRRVLELEREVAKLEGERGELHSRIAATETEIAEKELEIYQVQKGFRESVVNELKQIQGEIFDFRERLNAARHVHGQTEVLSPVDGVVVGSDVHTVGGVVGPGATLLEIVPDDDDLIVEARIEPRDIDDVRPKLPAGIRFTAFNQRTTPEIKGEVQYVSADALQDPKTGQAYFVARIGVVDSETNRLGDKRLQPGMMAEVFIRTGERTAADYLLQPLRDSFRRAWMED